MDDLEEIKKRKLRELQQRQQQAQSEEKQVEEQIQKLEAAAKQVMTRDALIRYGNVKSAHPQTAVQVLLVISQAIKKGNITSVTDETLKSLLQKLTPKTRESKIKRI